jgi:oligopeptide/dipeptide ABC transporter ATP-binding protein
MTALLEARNLVKHFHLKGERALFHRKYRSSQLVAVDDVSFSIEEGEKVGLVGESGCGKSTLVRLLARLLDQTSGSLRFMGVEISAVPVRRFARSPQRAQIQVVFQDPTDSLNPHFVAFDAIADPIRRLRPMSRADLLARVVELARLCGLPEELLYRYPHQLSGGQKARIGIARALALEPRLLILDEPTSALDVSVQVVILHLLEELKERLGLSYLFVSHDLNVVRLLCNRVLVMYSGKIVESGPTSAIFGAPAHPYTAALLSAIPDLRGGEERPRIRLPGEPASPINPHPDVCRLYGRCPKGAPRCAEAMPPLAEVGETHRAACHFPWVERLDAGPARKSGSWL